MPNFVLVIFSVVTLVFQVAGICFAVRAVLISRTPQASIAWGFALIVLPYVAIPAFLIFGESRFSGYTLAGAEKCRELDDALARTQEALKPFACEMAKKYRDAEQLALRLRGLPATRGNSSRLLVDGEETFPAIFAAIDKAARYVVVQFYIVHDDKLGRVLKERLLAARARGVRCWSAPQKLIQEL